MGILYVAALGSSWHFFSQYSKVWPQFLRTLIPASLRFGNPFKTVDSHLCKKNYFFKVLRCLVFSFRFFLFNKKAS